MFYWLNCNIGYDGDIYVTIVLNGFIHSVMYTYYFVSMHTVCADVYARERERESERASERASERKGGRDRESEGGRVASERASDRARERERKCV